MSVVLRVVCVLLHVSMHRRLRRVMVLLWMKFAVLLVVVGGRTRMESEPSSPLAVHRCGRSECCTSYARSLIPRMRLSGGERARVRYVAALKAECAGGGCLLVDARGCGDAQRWYVDVEWSGAECWKVARLCFDRFGARSAKAEDQSADSNEVSNQQLQRRCVGRRCSARALMGEGGGARRETRL